jgi:predicted Zn-ribbon and HTH transcriptional regulator
MTDPDQLMLDKIAHDASAEGVRNTVYPVRCDKCGEWVDLRYSCRKLVGTCGVCGLEIEEDA